MSNRVRELRARKATLVADAKALIEGAGATGLSADDKAKYNATKADIDAINETLAAAEAIEAEERSMSALPGLPAADNKPIPDKGFSTFGEQLQAIAQAGMNKGHTRDTRLVYQAASGLNEGTPSEGGFLVQKDFSTELLAQMHEMGEIISRVRRVPISANSNGIKLPAIDETSRANGSRFGGVLGYWANEADTVTASKPKFREMDLSLKKLFGLSYATEELLADSVALGAVLNTAFTEELTFKTEDAIFNGTGAGQPLGILNSGALVTVTAESGQAAATIRTENILKMWARTPVRGRRNLVWMINQDIEPQLYSLTLGSGTAVQLLYTPPGVNGNNSPYGLLMGRPVIPIEYAATLGTVGDIVLFDPQQYVMIDKGGVAQASSMHVRFIYEEMTFRFTFRVDGQPVWNSAVTPFKGSNTISPYIALASR